jgi:hypothetical protein
VASDSPGGWKLKTLDRGGARVRGRNYDRMWRAFSWCKARSNPDLSKEKRRQENKNFLRSSLLEWILPFQLSIIAGLINPQLLRAGSLKIFVTRSARFG